MARQSASIIPQQVGRYRIVRLIGHGAMGQVLLGHDPALDRPVAVKCLRDDLTLTPDQLASLAKRMEQEARASARVSHPNLVALHDMGHDAGVGLFLVFEYVEGLTLQERLAQGRLTSGEAARLSRELGSALSMAHAAQVLHRDIKPENVILAKTGIKVADFGIARLPDSTLTRPGGLLGTPAYSAPEAIDHGSFSTQSDQFSMACTMFEAISGQRAFPGDEAAQVAALVQTTEPPALAAVFRLDPRVDTVLARAFAKHPGSRFASCEEFGNALADALEANFRASMITQPDGHHRALSPARRRGHSTYAAGVGLVLLLAIGGAVAYRPEPAAEQAVPTRPRRSAAPAQANDAELHPVAWRPARKLGSATAGVGARKARRREAAQRSVDAGDGAGE